MNKYKPGYRTSEFWFTLVSFIFSGLYLTGLITENDQKEELITIVSHAVESCILIGGQAFVFYKYISARQAVKQIEPTESPTIPIKEEINDEPSRNNTNRNRKNNNRNKSSDTKRKRSSTKRSVENSTTSRSSGSKSNRKSRSQSNKSRKKTDSSGND
jgi:hypothetical protein